MKNEFDLLDKSNIILHSMGDGFAYHKILLNDSGIPYDYVFLDVNKSFENITGLEKTNILGKTVLEVIPDLKYDSFDWIGTYGNVALTGVSISFEHYSEALDKWFNVNVFSVEKNYFITIFHDISSHKYIEEKLRANEDSLINAQKLAHIGNWELYTKKKFFWGSKECFNIFGINNLSPYYPMSKINKLIYATDREKVSNALINLINGNKYFKEEIRIKRLDNNEERVLDCRAVADRNSANKLIKISGMIQDITDFKKAEARINYLAYIDPVTNLPNRTLLFDKINEAISLASNNKNIFAVFLMDLDNFKTVNDTLGHQFGDSLLKNVGTEVSSFIRKGDTFARLGGDEFVLLLPCIESENVAKKIALKIVNIFRTPWLIDERKFYTTVSLGISFYPKDGLTPDALIKSADSAMYKSKELGKNMYQLYTHEIDNLLKYRFEIENDLRYAIYNKELTVHYQPQINLANGNIISVEALVRWKHPEKGMISPINFIPIAEENGLIIPLSKFVLCEACKQIKDLSAKIHLDLNVSVNISSKQFHEKSFIEDLNKIIIETGISPKNLELEVTESIAINNSQNAIEILKNIRNTGIQVALDDFGTGYSSLNYLKNLPIDKLKIDKSFIDDISNTNNTFAITETIIELAHKLNLIVIAEGVETINQLKCLSDLKCDMIQGYYYSKPLSITDLENYLSESQGTL